MPRSTAGYALVETLVAAAIVVGLAAGVARVALATSAAVRESGAQGRALFLAVQKIEQLQSLLWTVDDRLEPISDEATDLAFDPPATGGGGLQPSGPITGPGSGAGNMDYLDRDGRWVGTGGEPPPGTAFVRRWSVSPIAAPGGNALLLQVVVVATSVRGPSAARDPRPNDPGVTWLAGVRVRH
jgi:type II secretory pathway pseudopilin PulG